MPREVREEFLKKLRGLMGSSSSQSVRILDEIEDHLLAQHQELVERGVEHDKAWQQVIDEFGDVDDFVGSQSQLEREIRWRWMMRYTTLTILGAFGILVGFMAMAPETSRLRTPLAVAQEDAADDPFAAGSSTTDQAATPADPQQIAFVADSNDEEIRAKLSERITIEMEATNLSQVIEFLSKQLEVDFYCDSETGYTLEDIGAPSRLSFRSIRVSMLLDLVLREHGLTASVVDGIVMIHDSADSRWDATVRVYNVSSLLSTLSNSQTMGAAIGSNGLPIQNFVSLQVGGGFSGSVIMPEGAGAPGMGQGSALGGDEASSAGPGGGMMSMGGMPGGAMMGGGGMGGGGMGAYLPGQDSRLQALIVVISQTIAPDQWMEMGGTYSISGIDGLIVIRAPEKVHSQIAALLEEMTSALAQ